MKGIQFSKDNNNKESALSEKSVSTSSFYRPNYRQFPRQSSAIHYLAQTQERETKEQIQKLKQVVDLKVQYFNKRTSQSLQQYKKNMSQLIQQEKKISQLVKEAQNQDKTKQWGTEMEKTIQGIMTVTKDTNIKNFARLMDESEKLQAQCDEEYLKQREQKKIRQKQWESIIDSVGGSIINTQSLIQQQRWEIEQQITGIQSKILDLEQLSFSTLEAQKAERKQQHEHLTRIVQRIMDKLIC